MKRLFYRKYIFFFFFSKRRKNSLLCAQRGCVVESTLNTQTDIYISYVYIKKNLYFTCLEGDAISNNSPKESFKHGKQK